MNNLQLSFVDHSPESYLATIPSPALANTCKVLLHPWCNEALSVVTHAAKEHRSVRFFTSSPNQEAQASGVFEASANEAYDAIFLFHQNPAELSASLLDYLDLKNGHLVAPITEHYFKSRPLFLISIPKSGTHLLYELAEAFGYHAGVVCPDTPQGGHWYCIEYSNSHTVAKDFFIDTVRRSPFGNRHHCFPRCPALFIYRNPMDIVVSEANYYHREGATAFAGYLANKNFEERLLRLIDDPWLLGSIRDRIANFAPWLDFPNVVPVSFEELIGPSGGGNLDVQSRLIWSLQLKLHVPGKPKDFGNRVFNRESATFHAGRIGAHTTALKGASLEKFNALPQDFMEAFGYPAAPSAEHSNSSNFLAARTEEFRKRPLAVSSALFDHTPITVIANYLQHNIVLYKGRYIAIPQSAGKVNVAEAIDKNPNAFATGPDIVSVERTVMFVEQDSHGLPQPTPPAQPSLIQSINRFNIVFFKDTYFVIPMALGPVNLEFDVDQSKPGILKAPTLEAALALADSNTPDPETDNEKSNAGQN